MSAEIIDLFPKEPTSKQPGTYVATWFDHKAQREYDLRYYEEEGMYLIVDSKTDNLVEYFNDEELFTQKTRLAQIAAQTVFTVTALTDTL